MIECKGLNLKITYATMKLTPLYALIFIKYKHRGQHLDKMEPEPLRKYVLNYRPGGRCSLFQTRS
jgi:hypothetical protein